ELCYKSSSKMADQDSPTNPTTSPFPITQAQQVLGYDPSFMPKMPLFSGKLEENAKAFLLDWTCLVDSLGWSARVKCCRFRFSRTNSAFKWVCESSGETPIPQSEKGVVEMWKESGKASKEKYQANIRLAEAQRQLWARFQRPYESVMAHLTDMEKLG